MRYCTGVMKKIKFMLVTAVVLLSGTTILAQGNTSTGGMTSGQALMNAYGDAARAALARGAGSSAADRRTKQIGAAKIQAGKATTRFTPSQRGTEYTVEMMTYPESNTQTLAQKIRAVQESMKHFNATVTDSGMTVNDYADGLLVAYALAYEAYYDKKKNPQELKAMLAASRAAILEDAFYQGTEDWKKQKVYESYGLTAVDAMNYRIQARNAKNARERTMYEEKAREYAAPILEDN